MKIDTRWALVAVDRNWWPLDAVREVVREARCAVHRNLRFTPFVNGGPAWLIVCGPLRLRVYWNGGRNPFGWVPVKRDTPLDLSDSPARADESGVLCFP